MRDDRRPGSGGRARRPHRRLLTDFDEAELTRQHSPLMSPLVWDLAHIGQQEDLWLLRGGDPAGRACSRPDRAALRRLRAPARRAGVAAAAAARRGPLVHRRRPGPRLRRPRAVPDTDDRPVPVRHGRAARAAARRDHARHPSAARRRAAARRRRAAAAGPARPADAVLVPGGEFVLGVDGDRRAVVAGQRAPRARRRPAGLPRSAGCRSPTPSTQRFVDAGGYDAAALWSAAGWAHRIEADLRAAAVLVGRRFAAPLRHRRGHPARRAGAARLLLRGRGLRRVGRRAAAHRAGVGEGLRLGPGAGPAAPLAVGRRRAAPRSPTSAARRCGPRRSAPTRRAPRPTASSS